MDIFIYWFKFRSIGYSILLSVITFSILYLMIFRNLVLGFFKSNIKKSITWSKDIWPLQWKTTKLFFWCYNSL